MTSLLFFIFIFGVILSIVGWSIKNGISPMPTSGKVKKALFNSLPKLNGTIYDLGSGWGTLVFPLAATHPESEVIGYETSPLPYFFSNLRLKWEPRKNLTLFRRDFFSISLNRATIVFCYLYPGAMNALEDKFEKELKKGAWVISHTFALPHWKPLKVIEVNDLYHTKIYLYQKR